MIELAVRARTGERFLKVSEVLPYLLKVVLADQRAELGQDDIKFNLPRPGQELDQRLHGCADSFDDLRGFLQILRAASRSDPCPFYRVLDLGARAAHGSPQVSAGAARFRLLSWTAPSM